MCRSMVDIQSATAEMWQGKNQERKKKQEENIMSDSAMQGSHNNHLACLKYARMLGQKPGQHSLFKMSECP